MTRTKSPTQVLSFSRKHALEITGAGQNFARRTGIPIITHDIQRNAEASLFDVLL